MSQKGFSAIYLLIIIVTVGILVGGLFLYKYREEKSTLLISRSDKDYTRGAYTRPTESSVPMSLANPASENCIKQGGILELEKRGDGGEYGICNFPDDQSCEEWALYRKKCPVGGIKTIGFDTKEEIYCVLIGGKTTTEADGNCTLPDGKICSNIDLYNGKCQ